LFQFVVLKTNCQPSRKLTRISHWPWRVMCRTPLNKSLLQLYILRKITAHNQQQTNEYYTLVCVRFANLSSSSTM